jgi:cytochrome P450
MGHLKLPPGPKGVWPFGSTIPYGKDPLGYIIRCARKYGDIFRMSLLRTPIYTLTHPDYIEYVLRTNHRNFVKDYFTHQVSRLVGQGLLTNEGESWRKQRQLAQPAFQMNQLQKYGAVMVDATERLVHGWHAEAKIDVHQQMMRLALDIVSRALFSADVADDAAEVGGALEEAMKHLVHPLSYTRVGPWLPTPGLRRFHRARRRLDGIIYRPIQQRRQTANKPDDFLTRLLTLHDEDGREMSDRQVRDELMTLFLAGHETTALAMSYCFYLLARHPGAEQRLADEIEAVTQGSPPTAADLPRLPFAESVIKETMRLYPPAWGIGREPVSDCEIGGYHVPAGTQIQLIQYVVHRDPRWFDDPELFRPERWDNDFSRRIPRCAYFPFGDGPRICIGNHFAMMEAVLILATIIPRFRLRLVTDHPLDLIPSVTLRPRHGIPMVVHRISQPSAARPHGEAAATPAETRA